MLSAVVIQDSTFVEEYMCKLILLFQNIFQLNDTFFSQKCNSTKSLYLWFCLIFQIVGKGNYDPPDLVQKPVTSGQHKSWLYSAMFFSASIIAVIAWKKDFVINKVQLLWN